MEECICNSCRNLKAVITDDGAEGDYNCVYGFPSENCGACTGEECNESCSHYISDEEDVYVTVKCCKCGKELTKTTDEVDEGEVYCIDCYFKMQ